jgi:hypothetical protein
MRRIKMKIKKTIEIKLEKTKTEFICSDSNTMNLILGTKAAMGNKHIYGIKNKDNGFAVPIKKVKERLIELEKRKDNLETNIDIMKQVLK